MTAAAPEQMGFNLQPVGERRLVLLETWGFWTYEVRGESGAAEAWSGHQDLQSEVEARRHFEATYPSALRAAQLLQHAAVERLT